MQSSTITWNWFSFEELTPAKLYTLLALRQDVFILEQRCFFADIDDKDQQSIHLMGILNNELVAYLRFLPQGIAYPNDASFGRFVVRPNHRGHGFGKLMMREMLDYVDERYPDDSMCIMAQQYLQSFYEHFGFQMEGEPFDDAGIMHITMRRS